MKISLEHRSPTVVAENGLGKVQRIFTKHAKFVKDAYLMTSCFYFDAERFVWKQMKCSSMSPCS